MPPLSHRDVRTLDDAFEMGSGYVLNFSDRTMAEFFEDEFGVNIEAETYKARGSSKAKRLRTFARTEDGPTVARVLRGLWAYREGLARDEERPELKTRLFDLIARLEGGNAAPRTDGIERFSRDETLEELVLAIERDCAANKPAAALDRLHTYCMKFFAHLLERHGVSCSRDEPLHSRAGKYLRALEAERRLREITKRIAKGAISVLEQLNKIRNDESLAHDNALVDPAEARMVFDSVCALLRFFRAVDGPAPAGSAGLRE